MDFLFRLLRQRPRSQHQKILTRTQQGERDKKMKRFLWFSTFILVMSGALAGQTVAPPKAAPKKSTSPARVTVKEVQELRDALAAQQRQSEEQRQQLDQLKSQLQQLLDATQQANASAQKVQGSAEQAQTTAAQAQQSAAEAQRRADQASSSAAEAKTALSLVDKQTKEEDKRLSALQDVLGRFRFGGDIRVRGEDIFQDCPTCFTRNRARLRVRFGLDGRLNENFIGGFALATGSLGDSTSANETLTNFFERKTIGLDRGYITFNPVAAKWLSLTGGKWAYTWTRTSLTLDPDINPEGFNQKFSWDLKTPWLKNVTFQAMQLLYNEVAKGDDSVALGGNASATFQLGPLTSTPSFTLIDWGFPDAILNASAFATQATSSGNPPIQIPGEGPGCATGSGLPSVPPCAIASNGMTNATVVDKKGQRHFLSGYEYADFIVNNQLKTGLARFPLNLMLEYESNLKAAQHPLDSKGTVITSIGSQGRAYLGEISIGQVKNRNDLQFGYGFWRSGQDSILATFSESEQRAATNIIEHHIFASWRLRSNTVAAYNAWIGRTLNSNLQHAVLAPGVTPGQTEPFLVRHQFDLIYSF
jgi:Putative porin